jgi:Fe-S cluster assembly ATP-binding protein
VHVLVRGRIVRSGDKSLALELEERGYDWLLGEDAGQSGRSTAAAATRQTAPSRAPQSTGGHG